MARGITYPPNGDTDTGRYVIASLDDLPVLLRVTTLDIELCDSNLRRSPSQSPQSRLDGSRSPLTVVSIY